MNTFRCLSLSALALLSISSLVACASDVDTTEVVVPPLSSSAEALPASAVAIRIEQASRALDVGRDAASARASLEQVLADPQASPAERDLATLALSRALEAGGDRERATTVIEDLLAAHVDDHRWSAAPRAEARLRELVTGTAEEPARLTLDRDEAVAPFARLLARYFPADADGTTRVQLLTIHRDSDASDELGTFNVAGAVKAMKREACPLCDESARTSTSSAGESSWVAIPKSRDKIASSLVAFYVDLGAGRIPSRYDALLPLSTAEIAAHLEKGEGLVVARDRAGAPPVLVVAAPREAELPVVEAALAKMTALPASPVVVPLDPALRPAEIRAAVRAKKPAFRACYEALLGRVPDAAGKIQLAFAVEGDGHVDDARVEADAPALRDATFERCVLDATSALAFPATGVSGKTTVRYPLSLAPDARETK
jgi:hypothetical protein